MEVCSGGRNEDEAFSDLLPNSWARKGGRQQQGKRALSDDEEAGPAVRVRLSQEDELKVVIGFKEGCDIGKIGLVALTTGLKKALGEVERAYPMRGGSRLLIQCKNKAQRDKALSVQTICKLEVSEVRMFGERRVKGVISGIPLGEKVEDLMKAIKGGTVVSMRRLQAKRNGERVDSTSVLLEFKEAVLPERVMVGYMSFCVREYVPPPMRCYKCQRYGHIAKVCHSKQRCGKCGGEHEYGQCSDAEIKKCCNCGGDHTAAYGGCPARKKAVVIQQVKTSRNLTYADAAKIVQGESGGDKKAPQATLTGTEVRRQEEMINPEKLILFIAYVVNCAEDLKSKTDKLKMIVKAASKFLNIGTLSWNKVQEALHQPFL